MHPAFLLLLLLFHLAFLLRVATATADEANATASCTPQSCGNLAIRYPFSLSGMQPAYCGYPVFDLTCDAGGARGAPRAYLNKMFRDHLYRVDDIYYHNSSMVVGVETTFGSGDGSCPVPDFNVSASLAPFPFTISATNMKLIFFYNCNLPSNVTRACSSSQEIGVYLSDRWNSTAPSEIPANCSTVSVPVREFHGEVEEKARDYSRLISDGFLVEWPTMGECDACRQIGGECRFLNAAFQCVSPTSRDRSGGKRGIRLILIASLSTTTGLFFTCLVWIMHRRMQRQKYAINELNTEEVLKRYQSLTPKRYKYSDLKKITSFFKEKLGEGGYGMVFKGNLQDGRVVAVKLLSGSKGNGEEFLNEVTSIGRTSHVNIVNLIGFCLQGTKRALVYEYMANGSLEKYINCENSRLSIGWESLQKIAIGVARGLEYLHQGCSTRIIHFDIKPQNILLNEDFCPKIADFGLAKLCHLKESALSMAEARGTIGFIAPEVFSRGFGVVSTKSDVYSYGMMLLEMVGGRKNVRGNTDNSSAYFPNWIYDHVVNDLQSHEVTCEKEEIERKITLVGLWCIQTAPGNRPSMTKVIEMLEKNIEELEMPPKPLLSCPFVPSHFSSGS